MIGTKPKLWPHQQSAKDFVDGKETAMLAMVMRSGKSRVTVELLDERQCMNVLLICPKSVLEVWPEQFAQYSDRGVVCQVFKKGSLKDRTEQAKAFAARTLPVRKCSRCDGSGLCGNGHYPDVGVPGQPYQDCEECGVPLNADFPGPCSLCKGRPEFSSPKVFIINIDAFWRKPFIDWAMKYPFDAFICDESHRLKAPGGVASRAAQRLCLGGGAERPNIPFRLALTGTPMPHDPLDLYAQYRFLDSSVFGTNYQFLKHRYTVQVPANGFTMTVGYRVAPGDKYFRQDLYDEFQEKFHRLAYVVGPEVLNLPEPLHITRYCEMSAAGRKTYESLEKDFYAQVEAGEITASNAMVKALRLQQATSGFAKLADSGDEVQIDTSKQELLADILSDLNEPVVVFCRFRHDLDAVREICWKLSKYSFELSGRTNGLKEWQEGQAPILAVQTQAGGVGIDLSRAKIAIYYSLGLSLGDHLQSLSRLQAKDMARHPTYYYLLAKGTVDEKVYRALESRKEIIEEIMKR